MIAISKSSQDTGSIKSNFTPKMLPTTLPIASNL
uniref:Uncharacterized protein n=3 Tax=Neisseria meningitidis TaxID=487 RepID=C6SJ92_NEIME|nr:hypothetical protein predicted by Glimmer/Critica [Neisseria meningitidis alpha275]CBA07911.1 hypothetical protein predicted by Glimmer/Critica [Neisseria meningitidis alpha153]CCA44030.1 hypothetical protein NMALPHA522_0489 [Neisseria meningitidis alpha522]